MKPSKHPAKRTKPPRKSVRPGSPQRASSAPAPTAAPSAAAGSATGAGASPTITVQASDQAHVASFIIGRDFNGDLNGVFDPYDDRHVMIGSRFRGASGRRNGAAERAADSNPTDP